MAFDPKEWQTVIVRKRRLVEINRVLQKRSRASYAEIIDLALHELLKDPHTAQGKLADWLEKGFEQ